MRRLLFVSLMLVPVFAAQAAFVGDDVLRLTASDLERANLSVAHTRIAALVRALKIPEDERNAFPDVRTSKLVKFREYTEVRDCDSELLIAQSGTKIIGASNCVVIASGAVDISFSNRTIVIALDSIQIGHDAPGPRDASGIYITKGKLEIHHGKSPYIYALRGARTTAPGLTSYNTTIDSGSLVLTAATRNTIDPIFRGEPKSGVVGTSMRIDAGEYMNYSGTRCKAAMPDVSLMAMLLPSARKFSKCPTLTSANVTCETGEDPGEHYFSERWAFEGCGRGIVLRYQGQRTSRDPSPAGGATASLSVVDDRSPSLSGPAGSSKSVSARSAPASVVGEGPDLARSAKPQQ